MIANNHLFNHSHVKKFVQSEITEKLEIDMNLWYVTPLIMQHI